MDQHILRIKLRKRMKERLKEWIPDNHELRDKEMRLFDKLMSRRDFLKMSTIVAASLLLNDGCSNHDFHSPPSNWDEAKDDTDKETGIGEGEQIDVSKASKILVDSDVMDGMQHYDPLKAAGSVDAPEIKGSAILESFNPHIMTVASSDTFAKSGFNPLHRNYGIPEYIHLNKDSDSKDYHLAIYEKSHVGHHGLKETIIPLENTASLHINSLVTANGNFHNKVENQIAYNQKMVLLANTNNTNNPALRLYYQESSCSLLQPGVTQTANNTWAHLDLIEIFTQNETYTFSKHSIVEVKSYNDGSNHSFLYGTIRFDDLYNYGFIATFNSIDTTQPTVTFFTPKFLSIHSSMISKLQTNFRNEMKNADLDSDSSFKDFSIFSNQKFVPFTQVKDVEGKTQSQVLFSFLSFDTASDLNGGEVDIEGEEVDLDYFCDTASALNTRYLVAVDTSSEGVTYLLPSYTLSPSITIDEYSFILDFDTSAIPSIDIWKEIYNPQNDQKSQTTVQFEHTFVRSIQNDGDTLHLILATSFYDGNDLGVTHKSVKINYEISNTIMNHFTLKEKVSSVDSKFETTLYQNKGYKDLWFNDMKIDTTYSTLGEYVYRNSGVYDFYCTHTHQGLLRSYFVVQIKDKHSFLIGYNEQGENPDGATGKLYDYQSPENLYNNIVSKSVKHYPPLPIALNPDRLFKWYPVAQESEVLYIAPRTYVVNEKNRTLITNDGSKKLLSYNHASADSLEGIWTTHEQEKQVPTEKSLEYQYKVTSHQVHLHLNNIYDYPAALEDNTYVELRFSKPLIVTDHSDVEHPITYHVGRLSSLFLKSDSSGRIALDIKAGANKNDIFKGATMMYRFLHKSDLDLNENEPVAVVSDTSGNTTEFQQCNISFKQFERLSSGNADTPQIGASLDSKTAQALFDENVVEGQKKTISSFTDAYGTLYKNAQPNNDLPSNRIQRTNSTTTVDPLVYIVCLQTEDSMALGSIWDKVVDWGDKALHTITNVVNSLTHLAEDLAKSIKETVNKLVDDIKTIMSKIGASLSSIIVQIAAAFEKILTILISLVELVWEFVKALFDMNAAWKIGTELKGIFKDQFSPKSTKSNNVYSIIKNETSTLENKIDDITGKLKTNIDNAIDTALGYDLENDPSTTASKTLKDKQKNSTKYDYLDDQVERLSTSKKTTLSTSINTSLLNLETSSNSTCPSSDTVEELILCVGSKMSQTMLSDISTIVNDSKETVTGFIEGKTWNQTKGNLDALLKDAVAPALDETDTLLKGTLQLPLAFLNGSSLFDLLEEGLDDTLKPIFEALGLLIFQDKDKINKLSDIAYLTIGYYLNLSGLLLKDILSVTKTDIDIPQYIISGDLRADFNVLSKNTKQRNIQQHSATIPLTVIANQISNLTEPIVTRGCPPSIVRNILIRFSPLLFATLRIPSFIKHVQYDDATKKIFGLTSDFMFLIAQFTNVLRLWNTYEEDTKDIFVSLYCFFNVLSRLADLAEVTLDEKQKNTSYILEVTCQSIYLLQAILTIVMEVLYASKKPSACTFAKINIFLSIVDLGINTYNESLYLRNIDSSSLSQTIKE